MHNPPKSEPPEGTSDASRSAEKTRGESRLPLGAGAFASPLAWPASPESAGRKRHQLTAIALVSGALLSVGIVGVALLVSHQRAAPKALAHAAPPVVVRAEPPSEAPKQRPPTQIAKRTSATLTPIPSAPIARASKGTASAAAAPATGAAPAQPSLQALQPPSSEREPADRKARVDRARRASPPAPALPEALTRAQVIAAMRKITPAVHACFGSTRGKANVTFSVVGKTGRVVGARVTDRTGKVGSCIARSVRRARFPKFAKPRIEISYPFAR